VSAAGVSATAFVVAPEVESFATEVTLRRISMRFAAWIILPPATAGASRVRHLSKGGSVVRVPWDVSGAVTIRTRSGATGSEPPRPRDALHLPPCVLGKADVAPMARRRTQGASPTGRCLCNTACVALTVFCRVWTAPT
jgi:hypothetical protein